jgi:predicted permease
MLFKAISQRPIGEVLHIDYLLVYAMGSLASFVTVFIIVYKLHRQGMSASAISAMGGSFSNTLMVGFPVVTGFLGSAALVPFALTLLVENFVMMPLTLVLADIGKHKGQGISGVVTKVIPTLLKNPIIIAISIAVIFSLLEIRLPTVADTAIDLLSKTVSGAGLFVIGGMLVGFNYAGKLKDLSSIVVGKLLLHPLVVFLLFMLFPSMDPLLMTAGVILASSPMFGVYAVLGQRYDMGAFCAAALVPATVLSFVSITSVIWLLTRFGFS